MYYFLQEQIDSARERFAIRIQAHSFNAPLQESTQSTHLINNRLPYSNGIYSSQYLQFQAALILKRGS